MAFLYFLINAIKSIHKWEVTQLHPSPAKMSTCDNRSVALDCVQLSNSSAIEILGLLVPNCDKGSWTAITTEWLVMFYLYIVLCAPVYLFIAVVCLLFLYKRRAAKRFMSKTFVAIDIALTVLGVSRFVFYIIDPYGVSNFCTHVACVVVSRLLNSLAFPSLTASYTLVFLTLWQSAKLRLRRTAAEHWNIIIPLCCIHYVVAVVVEIIGLVGPYPVVFLLIGCEVAFIVWGFVVCLTFIVAGSRLLKSVRTSAHQSSVVCRDTTLTRDPDSSGSVAKVQTMRIKGRFKRHHKQAIRKVTIITYVAAFLGSLYSVLGLVQVTLNVMELFGTCSTDYTSSSAVWLVLKYVKSLLEVALALLLIYSSNDLRPFVQMLKTVCPSSCSIQTSQTSDNQQKSKEGKSNFQFSYDSKEKQVHNQKEMSPSSGSTNVQETIELPPKDHSSIEKTIPKEVSSSDDINNVEH